MCHKLEQTTQSEVIQYFESYLTHKHTTNCGTFVYAMIDIVEVNIFYEQTHNQTAIYNTHHSQSAQDKYKQL